MRILCRHAVVGILLITASRASAQEADPVLVNCAWSTTMAELRAAMPPVTKGATITQPKKKKGSIDRPTSRIGRVVRGVWIVEMVIDAKGGVRDAKIIQAPTIEPPWPEYEIAILKSVKTWKYSPLLLGNQPVPHCTTLTVTDHE